MSKMPHKIPKDIQNAINATPKAKSVWQDITPLAQNEWICWMTSGKKAETRDIRIKKKVYPNSLVECADRAVGQDVRIDKVIKKTSKYMLDFKILYYLKRTPLQSFSDYNYFDIKIN